MNEKLLDGKITLYSDDCLKVLATLPENSIDSCVTDPPYCLTSIVKRFGKEGAAAAQFGSDGRFKRLSKGFMQKEWDNDIAFDPRMWRSLSRILKPGAHLLAMGGTRTYHRLVYAIEDAGFEIRDSIAWLYATGFPKNHNVGEGLGTSLKPAMELIVLARKPLSEKTIAANVLKWGTGGLNIDKCRVPTTDKLGGGAQNPDTDGVYQKEGWDRPWMHNKKQREVHSSRICANVAKAEKLGRWPANILHDGNDKVISRYFYTAKADQNDRLGAKHPTVKPLDLIQYLVRLVTPKGGICIDPFAGTGTTGEAAVREGMQAILIEKEIEYQDDIRFRMECFNMSPKQRKFVAKNREHFERQKNSQLRQQR